MARTAGKYRPGKARMGEDTPQTAPSLFSDDEIKSEIKHLMRTNKKYGSHPLRTAAYMKLSHELDRRNAAATQ